MIKVRISLTKPKNSQTDDTWLSVAPGWKDLLGPYKRGEIDDEEYTRRYMNQLERGKAKILREYRALTEKHHGRDIVLLCWCKKGNFCHRRLLAAWLKKQGFSEIKEL